MSTHVKVPTANMFFVSSENIEKQLRDYFAHKYIDRWREVKEKDEKERDFSSLLLKTISFDDLVFINIETEIL